MRKDVLAGFATAAAGIGFAGALAYHYSSLYQNSLDSNYSYQTRTTDDIQTEDALNDILRWNHYDSGIKNDEYQNIPFENLGTRTEGLWGNVANFNFRNDLAIGPSDCSPKYSMPIFAISMPNIDKNDIYDYNGSMNSAIVQDIKEDRIGAIEKIDQSTLGFSVEIYTKDSDTDNPVILDSLCRNQYLLMKDDSLVIYQSERTDLSYLYAALDIVKDPSTAVSSDMSLINILPGTITSTDPVSSAIGLSISAYFTSLRARMIADYLVTKYESKIDFVLSKSRNFVTNLLGKYERKQSS